MACKRHLQDLERIGDDDFPFVFNEHIATGCIDFFPAFLTHTKGQFSKKPFELAIAQKFIVWSIFGWVHKDTMLRRFNRAFITVARKWGKALALDTPIATPAGFKCMRDLQVGDTVYDETGKQCKVTNTQTWENRPCYKLTFTDKSTIVADENHEWVVERKQGRNRLAQTLETKHLLDFKLASGSRYRIKQNGPLQNEAVELPVLPYLLGYWLGDGHSAGGRLTVDEADKASACSNIFPPPRDAGHMQLTMSEPYGSGCKGWFVNALRELDLLNNKHVPQLYLNASEHQRAKLLQGLMDSDGSIDRRGVAEFTNKNKSLADGVAQLARSLGYRVTFHECTATLNGKDCGCKYRVHFHPNKTASVFKLQRKADRQRESWTTRTKYTYIEDIEQVERQATKCIKVDSPSHMFLAGESLVPTHNSTFAAGIALLCLYADTPIEADAELYVAATKEDQACIVHTQAAKMILNSPDLKRMATLFKNRDKYKGILLEGEPYNGSVFKPIGSDSTTSDGLNPHVVIKDELHAWKRHHKGLKERLETGSGARLQPIDITISTEGDEQSDFFIQDSNAAESMLQAAMRGEYIADRFFAFIARLDEERPCSCGGKDTNCTVCEDGTIPGDDIFDESNWPKANPNIGVSPTWEYMRQQAERAKLEPEFKNTFTRFNVNMRVSSRIKLIAPEAWNNCADKFDLRQAEAVCGAFDLGWRDDLAHFGVCGRFNINGKTKYGYKGLTFCCENGKRKLHDDPWALWQQMGWLVGTPGNTTDILEFKRRLLLFSDEQGCAQWRFDPANALQLGTELMNEHGKLAVEFYQNHTRYNEPLREFKKQVHDGNFMHDGDQLLAWAVDNAVANKDSKNRLMPDKEKSKDKIDPFVCAVMSFSGVMAGMDEPVKRSNYYETNSLEVW